MKEKALILSMVLLFTVFSFNLLNTSLNNIDTTANSVAFIKNRITVVLDAGHGGEDGGAVAADGTEEKHLNLEITKRISDYFEIFGIDYIMVRSTDISVGDTSLDTIRKRKASDIKKRYDIINSTDNSVLLSIHQNYFPAEKYHGAQVFYAPESEASEKLANCIQNSIALNLQSDNKRKVKASDDSIYLLYNAEKTSVLVECGFMSNNDELALLKSNEYQSKLAYFITSGLINYISDSEE